MQQQNPYGAITVTGTMGKTAGTVVTFKYTTTKLTITDTNGFKGEYTYTANNYITWMYLTGADQKVKVGEPQAANDVNCVTIYDQCNYQGNSLKICQNQPNLPA